MATLVATRGRTNATSSHLRPQRPTLERSSTNRATSRSRASIRRARWCGKQQVRTVAAKNMPANSASPVSVPPNTFAPNVISTTAAPPIDVAGCRRPGAVTRSLIAIAAISDNKHDRDERTLFAAEPRPPRDARDRRDEDDGNRCEQHQSARAFCGRAAQQHRGEHRSPNKFRRWRSRRTSPQRRTARPASRSNRSRRGARRRRSRRFRSDHRAPMPSVASRPPSTTTGPSTTPAKPSRRWTWIPARAGHQCLNEQPNEPARQRGAVDE